jgi:hypothetical protein
MEMQQNEAEGETEVVDAPNTAGRGALLRENMDRDTGERTSDETDRGPHRDGEDR